MALFAVALIVAVIGNIRSASLPETEFLAGVIVDDAIYYVIPAQNLLAGKGYSFDGLHRTNGVQPLWALVTIPVVAFTPDRLSSLRALVLTGALFWAAAAILLFIGLKHIQPYVACLAAILFLYAGFTQRNSMQGMENGISAFCLAAFAYLGLRRHFSADWKLGAVLALLALCRVDALFLPVLFGLATLFGAFGHKSGSKLCWREAFRLTLPTAVLFGGYVVLNLVYFGGLLPVSGAVKHFYNQQFFARSGWPFGGFGANLFFHVWYPWELATSALSQAAARAVTVLSGVAVDWRKPQFALTWFVVAIQLAAVWVWRKEWAGLIQASRAKAWFWLLTALYLILHILLLALANPFFTLYGIWYFTPEILAGVTLVAFACWFAARFASRVAVRAGNRSGNRLCGLIVPVIAAGTAALGLPLARGVTDVDTARNMMIAFKRSGEWLNAHLPAGQRIATLSSGVVAFYANHHHVVNIDGLVNDYDFYRHLTAKKVDQYLYKEKIGYFADYGEVGSWRSGFSWQGSIPLERLELVRWWPVADGRHAYCIWRLPASASEGAGPTAWPADPRSQLEFAALVLNRRPVIEDAGLQEYLRQHPGSIVASSLYTDAGQPLKHVMLDEAQFRSLGWSRAALDIPYQKDATFGGSVKLLGVDAATWRVRRGGDWFYTRYWEAVGPALATEPTVDVYIHPKTPGWLWQKGAPAHGSYPFRRWKQGDLVVDSYRLVIPTDVPPGVYPVHIGLWSEGQGWVQVDRPRDSALPGMVFIGNLTIE